MAHTHNGSHHDHNHNPPVTAISRALLLGAGLNLVYVIVEFALGIRHNSLALTADAGHNLSDVGSLVLSLVAFRLAKIRQRPGYTYGFRKSTVLVSLANAVLLLFTVGVIAGESIGRLQHPEPVAGGIVAWVAGLGIIVNTVSALFFFRERNSDLNAKSAFLHLAADALVSLAVVVAGVAMRYTGWYWLDPALGLLIGTVILAATWRLLTDSLKLSLDGIPANINIDEVTQEIGEVPGVLRVSHIHIWAISTTETALTAHLVLQPDSTITSLNTLKTEVRHRLNHLGISHATLETEVA